MTPENRKTRVAILGGGPAGMAAAFELTATPELRAKYEVTVHQLGWRLGGKGASGRNAKHGHRIEEHGLHIWFGFYDNAFSLIRRCYEALERQPGEPLATWTEAFQAVCHGVQYECFNGDWRAHHIELPANDLVPGDPHDFGFWEILERALLFLESQLSRLWTGDQDVRGAAPIVRPPPRINRELVMEESRRLQVPITDFDQAPALHLIRLARHQAEEVAVAETAATRGLPARGIEDLLPGVGAQTPQMLSLNPLDWVLRLIAKELNSARDWMWDRVVQRRLSDDELRFFFMLLDLTAAMVNGIWRDRLWKRGFGAINNEEFRDWLKRNGARDLTLKNCPLLRAVYSAAFCFDDGDVERPNVAAGKAAQDAIRLPFFYKGAPMYKMNAGMGDTVFGPLYEVLSEKRGVKFEFFHWITKLELNSDGSQIDRIEFSQQAEVTGGEYKPLVEIKGLPCWPSEPKWDLLAEGVQLEAQGVDFERDPEPSGCSVHELKRDDEDFDLVVLAIPVGALPAICEELSEADGRFAQMLEESQTVMTQAFQVWAKKDAKALGSPYPVGTLTSCYDEPIDTYCDMSQTLPCEAWQDDEVALVAYFCGVLAEDSVDSQADADSKVKTEAIQYLQQQITELWPTFDWSTLVDPQNRNGADRFESQYWRANYTDTERYAQTPAGSVRYRLWPHESGFDNLVLAGDWTRNGIDGGAVEAAVTSGMLAARAICGSPANIQGLEGWLGSDRGDVGWTPPRVPAVPHG
jgi:uncharacterized protein with NAD-binding domain and iron-sulfur cluster